MDQVFLEREKELFKLNAKLNTKTKKITSTASNKAHAKPVQIHTANNHFNYYFDEPLSSSLREAPQDDGLEMMCKVSGKKINISNQPVKKSQEIVYPLFNRPTPKLNQNTDIHIHLPGNPLVADGKADLEPVPIDTKSIDLKSETLDTEMSFKNESLVTRFSDDSSAIPPAEKVYDLPMPPNFTNIIPRSVDKKSVSNDGLLKFVSSNF